MLLYEDHASDHLGGIVYALAFSPDGSLLASGARDGSVCIRDFNGVFHLNSLRDAQPTTVHALTFLGNDSLVVAHDLGWDQYLERDGWHREGLSCSVPTAGVSALSPEILAYGTGDRFKSGFGTFELFDCKENRRVEPFFRETYGVRTVAANPARKLVAWATGHKELKVWDVRRQTPLRFPLAHTSLSIALAPDGSAVAVAQDWVVRLIDLERKQDRAVLKSHKGIASAVAFRPDGSTVATGSWDQTVRLWDAATGRERAVFQWPIGKVFSLAYSPDGLRLAAGGDRGAVVIWDVD